MVLDIKPRVEASSQRFEDKHAILHEAKVFSKVPINVKKCTAALTRILGLLNREKDSLTANETTDIFFGATRLFECNDERLRRLVYLLIKSLRVNETEVFIVTSSLTKDINSPNPIYRANAIRALSCIVNANVASQIERHLKSSLVEKDAYVASSALLCCIGMYRQLPMVFRRWIGEATTCLSSPHPMVQFHATLLVYLLRCQDRQSLKKLANTLASCESPEIETFLVRLVASGASSAGSLDVDAVNLVKRLLVSKRDATRLEACKAVVELALSLYMARGSLEGFCFDMTQVVSCLQSFITSKNPLVLFAGMRLVAEMANHLPLVTSLLNEHIEALIHEPSVSSYALVALLQTGGADSIDGLLSRAGNLNVDLKIKVARALGRKCLDYPEKCEAVLSFYADNFRDETAMEPKREMIDCTIYLITQVPGALRAGLLSLCEFIEDCEYAELNARILKYLGEQVPKTKCPQEYVRFIYNRVLLEGPLVRCASIDAIAAIAAACPQLCDSLAVLLAPCLSDAVDDEELRERLGLLYMQIEDADRLKELSNYVNFGVGGKANSFEDLIECDGEVVGGGGGDAKGEAKGNDVTFVVRQKALNVNVLCSKLANCIATQDYTELLAAPMDLYGRGESTGSFGSLVNFGAGGVGGSASRSGSFDGAFYSLQGRRSSSMAVQLPSEVLEHVPPNVELVSTAASRLTDEEEDYSVSVTTYTSESCVVFEFEIGNTITDQILANVCTSIDFAKQVTNWKLVYTKGIEELHCNDVASCFSVWVRDDLADKSLEGLMFGTGRVTLNFDAKVGPSGKSYHEQFRANDYTLNIGNWNIAWPLAQSQHNENWDLWAPHEQVATFALGFNGATDAITALQKFFGPSTVTVVKTQNENIQQLQVAAKVVGIEYLAKANVAHAQGKCLLKLQIRCPDPQVATLIFSQLD